MLKRLFAMKYTGKIFSFLFTALQAFLSFLIMKYSSDFIKKDFLNMSVIYATIAAILGVMNILKDHISIYVDSQSPYNKELEAHSKTKNELNAITVELEEKKDVIHDVISTMNNTFINIKTNGEQLDNIKKIATALNKDKRLSNCGNSRIAVQQSYSDMFKDFKY